MTTIANAEFLDRLFTLLNADKLALPTMPEIATSIQGLLRDDNSTLEDLARLINQDAAITALLLQIANSAIFNLVAPVTSVDNAIKRLGRNVIETIVVGMAMEKLFVASAEITNRKLKLAWQHGKAVSSIAATLSRQFPFLKTEQAMLAGLIHDIGILPILTLAEEYPALLANEAQLDALIAEAHAQVGTAILKKWGFPAHIVEAVQQHENLQYQSGAKTTYADLVIVANLLSQNHTDKLAGLVVAEIPAVMQAGLEFIEKTFPELLAAARPGMPPPVEQHSNPREAHPVVVAQ